MTLRPAGMGKGLALKALVGTGLVILMVGGAVAADKKGERAGALKAVVDCRVVADPGERLACFDKAAAALDAAEAKGDVVVVDRGQMREARKAAFGFNFQMPSFMTQGVKEEELTRMDTTVASARQDPHGKWIVKLADGATWNQIDTEKVRKIPAGAPVTIRAASMGSYLLNVKGYGSFRAKREN
ncbi:MAG: hypothetical protein JWR84_92 [Caulobacter sp.]|nr:hypothetical protein [Caulobacter sp.]